MRVGTGTPMHALGRDRGRQGSILRVDSRPPCRSSRAATPSAGLLTVSCALLLSPSNHALRKTVAVQHSGGGPSEGEGGLVAGDGPFRRFRHALPERALADLQDRLNEDDQTATRTLLSESRRALREGRLDLTVPTAIAGGKLGWTARAGVVRQLILDRLSELQRAAVLSEADVSLVSIRFALDGYPGGAAAARQTHGKKRQATSNALNRALKVLAADLASQPLTPVARPMLSRAKQEEIVGTVLSTLSGTTPDFLLRTYIHAAVRRELLGESWEPGSAADATQRRRWNRLAREWIAIACDHLDRDTIPWRRYPQPSRTDRNELEDWLSVDSESRGTLSTGAVRALTESGIPIAFEQARVHPQNLIGVLTDGYRPLIELTVVARWAASEQHGLPDDLDRYSKEIPGPAAFRAQLLAVLAQVVALRGYKHLAVAYLDVASEVGSKGRLVGPGGAFLRFQLGLAHETISFLRGPRFVDQTHKWQLRLAGDLDRLGVVNGLQPLALAHAMIRLEHNAVVAGNPSVGSVSSLLEPVQAHLGEWLSRHPPENRRRFEIVSARLGRALGDPAYRHVQGEPAQFALESPPGHRYDEWYLASRAASASRWDRRRRFQRMSDEWRR